MVDKPAAKRARTLAGSCIISYLLWVNLNVFTALLEPSQQISNAADLVKLPIIS